MGPVRAIVKLFLLFLTGIPAALIQRLILVFTGGPVSFIIPEYWHRLVCRLLNIQVTVEGIPARGTHVIYIANHLSYLDITVLTGVIPASFVARGDVSGWPIAGTLARLQQTVFISRNRNDIITARDGVAAAAGRRPLIIFAEGTSSDGSTVLPFKSSLFDPIIENGGHENLIVQPLTLTLLAVDGKPAATGAIRDLYTWHGDMTLPPHLWHFLTLKGAMLRLTFHAPRVTSGYNDRKALCADCHADVTRGLEAPARAA